jgi:hypothetical protein
MRFGTNNEVLPAGWLGCRALLFIAAILSPVGLRAMEAGAEMPKFAAVAPFADLAAQAQALDIPLSGVDPAGEPGALDPGDSFTAIITFFEKGRRTQWLLFLRALPVDTNGAALKEPEQTVLYSGRSNRFEFVSSPIPARLQTFGPFNGKPGKSPKSRSQTKACILDKGYLSLGLDQAVATIYRANLAGESGLFYFNRKPPSAEEMMKAQQVDHRLNLSVEEERSMAGAIPALFSYFKVVQQTEGLQDILLRVVRKPSLWSVIKHVGVSVDFHFDVAHMGPAPAGPWGPLARSALYYVPFLVDLNHQPALKVTFVVTNPRPPLLSCGGIIGMLAEKPGDSETYLTLRIVSARLAGR